MLKPNNTINGFFYMIFFNAIYFYTFLTKIPVWSSMKQDTLVHPWLCVQYFFSYKYEFTKRGIVGSLFSLFGITPNEHNIIIFSILIANLFFILFYIYAKKSFNNQPVAYFMLFMVLFLLSPATAMQFAYDIGRIDIINFALLISIVLLLTQPAKRIYIVAISLLLFLMLMNHEAILFIGIPLVFAISYNEVQKKNYPVELLYIEMLVVLVSVLLLFFFGKAENMTLTEINSLIKQSYPTFLVDDALGVWRHSLLDNIALTISEYNVHVWSSFLYVIPLVVLYFYLFARLLGWSNMGFVQKAIFLSPLGILPMFILGHDFFRWFALMIVILFIAVLYLLREKRSPIKIWKKHWGIILALLFFSLKGPIGILLAFPKAILSF